MRVIAHQGDTLDALCWRHLGATAGVTEQALELNPGLSAHGPILPMGLTVTLPDQVQTTTNTNHLNLWD
jgi:phage tail protein X